MNLAENFTKCDIKNYRPVAVDELILVGDLIDIGDGGYLEVTASTLLKGKLSKNTQENLIYRKK